MRLDRQRRIPERRNRGPHLTITEATEVQAVYTLNAVKYTVSYGVLDGNGTVTVDPVLSDSPAQVNAGTGLTFTAQPETGFQVAGWYSDAAGSTVIPGTAAEQNSYTIGISQMTPRSM